MDEFVNLIGSVGFPIIVTMYLLTKIESKLENLSSVISQLAIAITDKNI